MKALKCFSLLILLSSIMPLFATYNINLIGFLDDIKSVSRHTSSFIDCLKGERCIKLFKTKACFKQDLSPYHQEVLNNSISLTDTNTLSHLIAQGLRISGISIYTDSQWGSNGWKAYSSVPNDSIIKCAYLVTERTEVPLSLVTKLNNNFDMLLVADEWLINVYRKSGVTIPIFSLPLALDLHSLLEKPVKQRTSHAFTFGLSAGFWKRKNQGLLMRAFAEEFGNDPHVNLIIHGRFGPWYYALNKQAQQLNCNNITLIKKEFCRKEYEDFISSLDCYVLISKGEGFSITPREALAANIPCILSNNTAHKTICAKNYVCSVKSTILEPAYCSISHRYEGYEFNCNIQDVKKALREVYTNYSTHLKRATNGREWVKEYLAENLRHKYLSLVKPQKVLLGRQNTITSNYLMTNSRTLFEKYRNLCCATNTIFKELV